MAITYLDLTNRVLKALNEVVLTSSTFASATGFHADVKDAINVAIVDVYTEEQNEWPFAWAEVTLPTVIGTQKYTLDSTVTTVDWDSFRLQKPQVTISSLTQTAGTATAATSSVHYLLVGDTVAIYGADQDDYVGTFTVVTVPTTTSFTFVVDSTATSPATGTIYCYPPFAERKLPWVSYDAYRRDSLETDREVINPDTYSAPEFVVRTLDNNILLSGKPDRVYPIVYEGFLVPSKLTAYTDTISVASKYEILVEQLIVDKALHYAYMFRDNLEQANFVEDRYRANVNKVRRMLIPQDTYMRHE
jgi:hypothetical protein